MNDITGMIVTVYDKKKQQEAYDNPLRIEDFTWEVRPFPKHQIRWLRLGKYASYWTNEFSPPELGADSAFELSLDY